MYVYVNAARIRTVLYCAVLYRGVRYSCSVRVRSESAALRQEVRDTVAEMADYKQQVQSYALEVKRIQDSLAAKEGERSNLLEQYRLLSLEADRFQSQSHQAIAQ